MKKYSLVIADKNWIHKIKFKLFQHEKMESKIRISWEHLQNSLLTSVKSHIGNLSISIKWIGGKTQQSLK